MSKVIMSLGYRSIVLSTDKAVKVAELLADAEIYESKWHSKTEERESFTTHHIYPAEHDTPFTMTMLTAHNYQLYKLAGKPE